MLPRGGLAARSAYISTGTFLASGECEAGWVLKGMGDGLVLLFCKGVILPPLIEVLRRDESVLDLLLCSLSSLAPPGLLGLFS
jgi:hypothetical protein